MTDTANDNADAPAVPEGWRGILGDGERILWQGRPDQAFRINIRNVPLALFGAVFAGFALFWMAMAAQAGGAFWMFGLIHFFVGVGMIYSATYWTVLKRRRTWYTLTDRRAFIATDFPFRGKRLDSYSLTPRTRLSLKAGNPGSVVFAREERRGNKGRRYTVDIGFEHIDGAEKVYALMREVQNRHEREA